MKKYISKKSVRLRTKYILTIRIVTWILVCMKTLDRNIWRKLITLIKNSHLRSCIQSCCVSFHSVMDHTWEYIYGIF